VSVNGASSASLAYPLSGMYEFSVVVRYRYLKRHVSILRAGYRMYEERDAAGRLQNVEYAFRYRHDRYMM
jgi:hypothetical protein